MAHMARAKGRCIRIAKWPSMLVGSFMLQFTLVDGAFWVMDLLFV